MAAMFTCDSQNAADLAELFQLFDSALIDESEWVEMSRAVMKRVRTTQEDVKNTPRGAKRAMCRRLASEAKLLLYHLPLRVVVQDIAEELDYDVPPHMRLELTDETLTPLQCNTQLQQLIHVHCQRLIYVVTIHGQVFVAPAPDNDDRITHSQLAGGLPVHGAGEIVFSNHDVPTCDWKIVEINNASGHYEPSAESLAAILNCLHILLEPSIWSTPVQLIDELTRRKKAKLSV